MHQPSLTALLPLSLQVQGNRASLCALAEVFGLLKIRVFFHQLGWVWLKPTEIWFSHSVIKRQRVGRGAGNSAFPPGPNLRGMKARNFALAPLEMLLLHPSWLLQEPQTLQTPQIQPLAPGAAPVPFQFGYLGYPGMLGCLWG